MSEKKHINASTIARIAGNILSGTPIRSMTDDDRVILIHEAVVWAREIAAEVERTEPKDGAQ